MGFFQNWGIHDLSPDLIIKKIKIFVIGSGPLCDLLLADSDVACCKIIPSYPPPPLLNL